MVTEQTERAISELRSAVASGLVWNADLTDWKFTLSNAVWNDTQTMVWPAMRDKVAQAFGYPNTPGNLFDVSAFSKRIEVGRQKGLEVPASVEEFLAKWVPVRELLDAAKPLVKKGRKPSENPTLTDPRTLESTGTCSICGRNVKYDDGGRIVNHGYEVQYHSFSGGCFGVGYRPWEVSQEGAVAYISALANYVDSEQEILTGFEQKTRTTVWSDRLRKNLNPGDEHYETTLAYHVRELRHRITSLRSNITYFEKKVADWAPATLPGIAAGFTK